MPDIAGQNILRTIMVEGEVPVFKAEDQLRIESPYEDKANR